MTEIVYLALGTNLGDRAANLRTAAAALPPLVQVRRASPVYQTPPWGVLEQPAFLNQVLEAETDLEPAELLAYLKKLEADLGRKPGVRYGPRLIDLDILFYGNRVVDLPGLHIPHEHLAKRDFVLVPLTDLAPELRHPLSGQTMAGLLAALPEIQADRWEDPAERNEAC